MGHPLCQNRIENQFRHIGRISVVLVPRTKLQRAFMAPEQNFNELLCA